MQLLCCNTPEEGKLLIFLFLLFRKTLAYNLLLLAVSYVDPVTILEIISGVIIKVNLHIHRRCSFFHRIEATGLAMQKACSLSVEVRVCLPHF